MKKSLLILAVTATSLTANAQKKCENILNAGLIPKTYVTIQGELVEVNRNTLVPITRGTCSDKIKYVDRDGAAPVANKIYVGGTIGWDEIYQVYPNYSGQVTRIDFQGGNWGSTETVTVKVHPLSGGIPATTTLGSASVTVSSASGEFGANFTSPVTVSGGFAVSVKRPTAVTDSIFVYYQYQTDYDGFSFVYYPPTMYQPLYDFSEDLDIMIRPTISFTLGAPVISASPSSICEGNSTFFSSSGPSVSHLNDYVINPGGWLSETINYGDGSPASSSISGSHTYSTSGTKTATASLTYDGWTTDCPTDNGTTNVTVNPAPVANFAWSSTNLAVTFTNMSTGATTYNWLFGDAGTATAPNPVHNYAASGTYTVELTANGSCGSDVIFVNISITDSTNEGNVGVVELEQGLLTNIYPNPANENITVDLSLLQPENTTLQLINATGQLIYTKDLGSVLTTKQNLDLTNYGKGVYFVRIVHNGKVSSRTFLKN